MDGKPIIVPMRKLVTMEAPNGEMHITQKGDTYYLEYHNPLFKGSPFKVPQSFSTDLSVQEIMSSDEVQALMLKFR